MTDAPKLEVVLEMAHTIDTKREMQQPYEVYRIVVEGYLDHTWSDWFDGLTIVQTGAGETILSGPLADQSALHGVLIKVRDLGLPLVSLTRIESGKPGTLT